MKLLISFCNQQNNYVTDNLVLLDTETKEHKSLFNFVYNWSITGITQDEDRIYVCYQDNTNGIIVLRKSDLSIELIRSFPEIKDGHSILVNENKLYVVSTGNDRILQFNLDKNSIKVEYFNTIYSSSDADSEQDINHINSVAINGDLYLTAFGKKTGEKWSSALNGYILNISNNKKIFENLPHPHSLNIINGDFWYTESMAMKIKRNEKTIIELEEGYVRGLAVTKNNIVIGVSTGRSISKSTKTINTEVPQELMKKQCKVILYDYDKSNAIKKEEFEFMPKYQEIYDIMVLT